MLPPFWVRDDVVIALHKRQIAEHGGIDGIRDIAALESALARPKNLYFYNESSVSIYQIAASYAYGISRNHPFLDGNKRTSLVVMNLFLKINGISINPSKESSYLTFINLAAGILTEDDLAKWIESNI